MGGERVTLTRGRPVGYVPGICNYDINLLSGTVMSSLWYQWVADLVVVVVKPRADEGNGDMLEDKTRGKRQDVKGKGPDILTKSN